MSKLEAIILLLFFVLNAVKLKQTAITQFGALNIIHNLNRSRPIQITTIEHVATFKNGCYRQRIIEPDLWNSKRFFETEQLICPATVNTSSILVLAQQIYKNNSATNITNVMSASLAALPTAMKQETHQATNVSHTSRHLNSSAFNTSAFVGPPAEFAATHPVISTKQQVNTTVAQPHLIPAVMLSNATSHVVTTSKKTVFYHHERHKSLANTLSKFNCFFLLMFLPIISCI